MERKTKKPTVDGTVEKHWREKWDGQRFTASPADRQLGKLQSVSSACFFSSLCSCDLYVVTYACWCKYVKRHLWRCVCKVWDCVCLSAGAQQILNTSTDALRGTEYCVPRWRLIPSRFLIGPNCWNCSNTYTSECLWHSHWYVGW